MSIVVIYDEGDRDFVHRLVANARPGTRIKMLPPRSSRPQECRMWAMLGDIARQYSHQGRHYHPEQWKILMMHACGQEVDFAPSLDGKTFIPFDGRSSEMGTAEMNEMIAFMEAWGAENGVRFRE